MTLIDALFLSLLCSLFCSQSVVYSPPPQPPYPCYVCTYEKCKNSFESSIFTLVFAVAFASHPPTHIILSVVSKIIFDGNEDVQTRNWTRTNKTIEWETESERVDADEVSERWTVISVFVTSAQIERNQNWMGERKGYARLSSSNNNNNYHSTKQKVYFGHAHFLLKYLTLLLHETT